jgi:ferredoxin
MPGLEPAGFHGLEEKRQALFMAIDHLYDQAGRHRPVAPLPAGAPFGTAEVDGKRCTLCMACVGACPGRALQHGRQTPELGFIESNCLQCGICTRTCPEDAIWITPRLLFDREARNRRRVLCEDQPFCCTACGRPFATRSVIENTLAKLRGHWMFQDERARKRLTLCDSCRVVDAVQDPALLNGDPKGQIDR